MKVEVLTSVAGAGFSYGPGIFEVGKEMSESDAFTLLRDGIAVIVPGSEPEDETIAAPEAAVTRGRGRPRGSRNRPKPDEG